MLFFIKKAIGNLLLPLPLFLLFTAIALFLLWFTRWQRSGKFLLSFCWLALLLLSLQPIAKFPLNSLENQYTTYQGSGPVASIVVLGGGYTYNPNWAPSSNLFNNSLARLAEGIRLYRQHPNSKLILTGGKAQNNPVSSADAIAKVALSLGVPRRDIILLENPRDTEQEANAVKALLGQQPFLLVTSASHMPRAMMIFKSKGMSPIAAVANQLAIVSPLNFWEKYFPSGLYLARSEVLWHETLGRLYLWIKFRLEEE